MSKLLCNVLKISGGANTPNASLVARLPGRQFLWNHLLHVTHKICSWSRLSPVHVVTSHMDHLFLLSTAIAADIVSEML